MATFVMFGKYSPEALKGISASRTQTAADLMKKHGGEIKAGYVLLGERDIVLVVDLPGDKEALQVSIALAKSTGVAFTTSPAMTVEEFDKLA